MNKTRIASINRKFQRLAGDDFALTQDGEHKGLPVFRKTTDPKHFKSPQAFCGRFFDLMPDQASAAHCERLADAVQLSLEHGNVEHAQGLTKTERSKPAWKRAIAFLDEVISSEAYKKWR